MNILQSIDEAVLLFIQNYIRNDFLTPIMLFFSSLGYTYGIFWLVSSFCMLFLKDYRRAGKVGFLSLFFGFIVTDLFLKRRIGRIRPFKTIDGLTKLGPELGDYCCPSSHATAASCAVTSYFLNLPDIPRKLFMFIGIVICFSRMYMGVHYLSDILLGILVGIVSSFVANKLVRKNKSHNKSEDGTQ